MVLTVTWEWYPAHRSAVPFFSLASPARAGAALLLAAPAGIYLAGAATRVATDGFTSSSQ